MADSKNVSTLTDDQFESKISGSGLSLVDFWAEWCRPCKSLAPTIEALANDYAGRVSVYKLDIDNNPMTPPKFHIQGIPTVILFKNGKAVDQIVGNQPREVFVKAIEKHL